MSVLLGAQLLPFWPLQASWTWCLFSGQTLLLSGNFCAFSITRLSMLIFVLCGSTSHVLMEPWMLQTESIRGLGPEETQYQWLVIMQKLFQGIELE